MQLDPFFFRALVRASGPADTRGSLPREIPPRKRRVLLLIRRQGGNWIHALSWATPAQAFGANGFPVIEVVQILDGSIAATSEGGFVVVAQVGSQLVEQEYAAGQ